MGIMDGNMGFQKEIGITKGNNGGQKEIGNSES
jgi:hypothetical protein